MRKLILLPALPLFLMGATTISQNVQVSVTPATNGALPPGVTLVPIDGETLTGPNTSINTTNTHNYYSSHGFTNAASSTFNSSYNNGGWDDPRFFPSRRLLLLCKQQHVDLPLAEVEHDCSCYLAGQLGYARSGSHLCHPGHRRREQSRAGNGRLAH